MNLFYDSCNFKIYLVTGGYNGKNIVSTEVMSSSGSHWKYVGNLPLAVRAPSGISVNNKIFITGTIIIVKLLAKSLPYNHRDHLPTPPTHNF